MIYADELSQYGLDAFTRAMIAARRRASQAFRLRKARLDEEHQDLEATQSSPFISDFEESYRARIALGKIDLPTAVEKIRAASWVLPEVIEHMASHLALSPPSAEDISRYEELEAEKELRRQEAEARRQAAAMADLARLLHRLERARTPKRSRIDDLKGVRVRGRLHHYYDNRRKRSISVKDYVKRVKISKAMLAKRRLES